MEQETINGLHALAAFYLIIAPVLFAVPYSQGENLWKCLLGAVFSPVLILLMPIWLVWFSIQERKINVRKTK